jgi:hypothetical protein
VSLSTRAVDPRSAHATEAIADPVASYTGAAGGGRPSALWGGMSMSEVAPRCDQRASPKAADASPKSGSLSIFPRRVGSASSARLVSIRMGVPGIRY